MSGRLVAPVVVRQRHPAARARLAVGLGAAFAVGAITAAVAASDHQPAVTTTSGGGSTATAPTVTVPTFGPAARPSIPTGRSHSTSRGS